MLHKLNTTKRKYNFEVLVKLVQQENRLTTSIL